jgi:hypothetical protein
MVRTASSSHLDSKSVSLATSYPTTGAAFLCRHRISLKGNIAAGSHSKDGRLQIALESTGLLDEKPSQVEGVI